MNVNFADTFIPTSFRRLLRYICTGCTFRGKVGNGRKRGTCEEDFLCHSDGSCKPICKLKGLQGDGKKRGSCKETHICFSDGSCRVPGTLQINNCRKFCTYLLKLYNYQNWCSEICFSIVSTILTTITQSFRISNTETSGTTSISTVTTKRTRTAATLPTIEESTPG